MNAKHRLLTTTLSVVAALSLLVGVSAVLLRDKPLEPEAGKATRFENYEQILDLLRTTQKESPMRYYFGGMQEKAAADASAPAANGEATSHSTTNIQVEGIDEADIVKTDGSFLYMVMNGRLLVYDVRDPAAPTLTYNQDYRGGDKPSDPMALYLDEENHRLVLLINRYEERVFATTAAGVAADAKIAADYYVPYASSYVSVEVYGLDDPSSPVLLGGFDQEGYYLDSRRIEDSLYLLTDKYTYAYGEGGVETLIPQYRAGEDGDEWRKIPAEDIRVYPAEYYDSFVVISASSTLDPAVAPTFESMLGYGSTVYVSAGNIYVAANRYDAVVTEGAAPEGRTAETDSASAVVETRAPEEVVTAVTSLPGTPPAETSGSAPAETNPSETAVPTTEPATPAPTEPTPTETTSTATTPTEPEKTEPTPTEPAPTEPEKTEPAPTEPAPVEPVYHTETTTDIYRFAISDGTIAAAGAGSVPGTIINQFAMDEKDGYLRIATTTGEMWRTDEYASANNIYVMDSSLTIVGSVEGLARNEQIKSVRFLGTRAYMVTFRTTDPLFVIDLSNPAAPAVLGKLKIPGFSEYLHPYGENLLIGFGQDAAEVGDRAYALGLKVSMFDVSDTANPKEIATLYLGDRGSYTELLYNHKALLSDPEGGLLGFPVTLAAVPDNMKQDPSAYGYQVYSGFVVLAYQDSAFQVRGFVSHIDGADPYRRFANTAEAEAFMNQEAGKIWSEPVFRGVTVGGTLFTLSNGQLRATSLESFAMIGSAEIPGSAAYAQDGMIKPDVVR